MQIGLSGVPGSGKSLLANRLKEVLIEKELYQNVDIVDNYAEELEKRVGLAMDYDTTYIGNVHIALDREAKERLSREKNDFSIVCGTIFETSAYAAQSLERTFEIAVDDPAAKHDWEIRTEAVMKYVACLFVDTVKYDKIYHLLPLSTDLGFDSQTLEKNLQAAFNAFNLFPVKHLEVIGNGMEEIIENRVNQIIEDITDANNLEGQSVQIKESDGSRIRPSEETGEEQAAS